MYAVIRRYTGATQLFDELARRRSDVEQVIKGVQGFRGYYLLRSSDGGASITICDDQAGTAESSRRAAEWISQNLQGTPGSSPQVTEGEVLYNF